MTTAIITNNLLKQFEQARCTLPSGDEVPLIEGAEILVALSLLCEEGKDSALRDLYTREPYEELKPETIDTMSDNVKNLLLDPNNKIRPETSAVIKNTLEFHQDEIAGLNNIPFREALLKAAKSENKSHCLTIAGHPRGALRISIAVIPPILPPILN